MICQDHTNRKCIRDEMRHCMKKYNSCLECEPTAHRCSIIVIVMPWLILLICIVIWLVDKYAFQDE